MSVEFVDELPPIDPRGLRGRGRSGMLKAFADELRDSPGKWAKHPTGWPSTSRANSAAYHIRSGRSAAFPIGEFEAETRGKTVYVRFVGGTA